MHALRYLKTTQPRFLFISLNDADEWGHQGNYSEYIKTLAQYDDWISELSTTLETMGDYGKETTLIVTTDHGRGDGSNWTNHGTSAPESKYIWLYAGGPKLKNIPTPKTTYAHNDIRPTIQAILNMDASKCEDCGRIISELTDALNQTKTINQPNKSSR